VPSEHILLIALPLFGPDTTKNVCSGEISRITGPGPGPPGPSSSAGVNRGRPVRGMAEVQCEQKDGNSKPPSPVTPVHTNKQPSKNKLLDLLHWHVYRASITNRCSAHCDKSMVAAAEHCQQLSSTNTIDTMFGRSRVIFRCYANAQPSVTPITENQHGDNGDG
jgi:hypothetical protein